MRKLLWITIPASIIIAGAGLFLLNYQPPAQVRGAVNWLDEPRHPVTDEQRDWALAQVGEKLPAEADLVVAIKDGCPCSFELQPHLNRLAKHYTEISFLGVCDKDADKFDEALEVPFELVEDADLIQELDVEQSAYVFLARDGKIEAAWPGYSRAMLVHLNEMLSERTGKEPAELQLEMAPNEMTSGCYFFKDDPVLLGE